MLDLADAEGRVREGIGCGVVYSAAKKSAFEIKNLAEAEKYAGKEGDEL